MVKFAVFVYIIVEEIIIKFFSYALALKLIIFYFEEPQYFRDDHIYIVEYSSKVTTSIFLNRFMDSELKAEFYFIVTCSIQKTNLFSLFD